MSRVLRVDEIHAGLALSSSSTSSFDQTRVLPFRIVWSGFAIDWAIYATTLFIAFSLIAIPEWIRRIQRRKRRACPECAYDLKAIAMERCPECGWSS